MTSAKSKPNRQRPFFLLERGVDWKSMPVRSGGIKFGRVDIYTALAFVAVLLAGWVAMWVL